MFDLEEDKKEDLFPREDETISSGVKVWIKGAKAGLGPGGYALFKKIDAVGSVKKACMLRRISYSKGWKIINGVEKELGIRIIERQQGGAGGGEAHLTEKGKQLLQLYEIYNEKVESSAKEIFEEVFRDSGMF